MLTTKSRDGVYAISAPDNAKTGCSLLLFDGVEETKRDKVQDVYLEVIEGQEGNLYNLANAIAYDCFSSDCLGLKLLAKQLRCHIKAGENKYEFTMNYDSLRSIDDFIRSIAYQTKL